MFISLTKPAYSMTLKMKTTCSSGIPFEFHRLQRIVSMKIGLFITTAVRAVEPTHEII
jgi:hypothetical protein